MSEAILLAEETDLFGDPDHAKDPIEGRTKGAIHVGSDLPGSWNCPANTPAT